MTLSVPFLQPSFDSWNDVTRLNASIPHNVRDRVQLLYTTEDRKLAEGPDSDLPISVR
jgi:hypothetical protein